MNFINFLSSVFVGVSQTSRQRLFPRLSVISLKCLSFNEACCALVSGLIALKSYLTKADSKTVNLCKEMRDLRWWCHIVSPRCLSTWVCEAHLSLLNEDYKALRWNALLQTQRQTLILWVEVKSIFHSRLRIAYSLKLTWWAKSIRRDEKFEEWNK